jgi:FAD:protein FMN transferase
LSIRFRALGTTAVVETTDQDALADAVVAVERELTAIDATCSRFRPDSELVRVNSAGGRAVHVSPLLLEALRTAVTAAHATDGLVDPTVGRALRLAGYDATFSVVAARDSRTFRARFASVPGWRVIEVDDARRTVRIPAGVELDLGATAKALAADRSARAAATAASCGVLVALGGDVAVAGPPPAAGWAVGFAADHAPPADPDSTVAIRTGGVATSATVVRRWRSGSAVLHHVIDPRTGRPADTPWRSVSVAAATCVDANTASAAAIVLGDVAPRWLEERRPPARLVRLDGDVVTVEGWPEGGV